MLNKRTVHRYIFSILSGVFCLFLTGCNPEARLLTAAGNGDVEAQYELAVYYSQLTPPKKYQSFEWMKQAAVSRYSPAMKKLAEYYLTGYGTKPDYQRVADWLTRYFEKNNNSEEALNIAKTILGKSTTRQDIVAGFILCKIVLTLENTKGETESDIAKEAAGTLLFNLNRVFKQLLEQRNFADAEKSLIFAQKITLMFPDSFPVNVQLQIQKMQKELTDSIESYSR